MIPEKGRFDRSVIPRIKEIVELVHPDVLQTHNVKSHFLLKLSGLNRQRPWLAFQHGYTDTDFKMAVYNQLDRWSLRSACRVVTVCRAFTRYLLSYGVSSDRIRVLHNSVTAPAASNLEDIAALRAKFGIAPSEKILLTVGRFSKEKGHADLVEALAHLLRLRPDSDWKALWVGSGPAQPALEQLAESRGVAGRIVFAGFQSAVTPFYAASAIVVVPSHSEGSPNVVLEAMAARVPIASTTAGGVPEIVADRETAMLSPVRDPRAIADSLAALLADPSLCARLSDAAAERARLAFSPEAYRRNLIEIYTGALAACP